MNIGFDYNNTITKYPELFHGLSLMIEALGGKVYIISGSYGEESDKARKEIKKISLLAGLSNYGIIYEEAILVMFKSQDELETKKLEQCQLYDIKYFFDDNYKVVEFLIEHGIKAARIK